VLLVGCPSNPYEEPRCTSPEIDVVFKNFSLPSYELTFVRSGQTLERAMRDPSARVTCPGDGGPNPADRDACYSGPNADFEFVYQCRNEAFFVIGAVQVLIRVPDASGASVERLVEALRCPCDGYAELYEAPLPEDTQTGSAPKILQDGGSCSSGRNRSTLFEADSCR
jgi:hypothetical protein